MEPDYKPTISALNRYIYSKKSSKIPKR